jgi:hypothetical protein
MILIRCNELGVDSVTGAGYCRLLIGFCVPVEFRVKLAVPETKPTSNNQRHMLLCVNGVSHGWINVWGLQDRESAECRLLEREQDPLSLSVLYTS